MPALQMTQAEYDSFSERARQMVTNYRLVD